MDLSTKRVDEVWKFPSGASLTFRKCESLDEDIASTIAVNYYKDITTGTQLRDDFALTDDGMDALFEKIGSGVDDTRAWSDYLFCVALMERLVSKAEGFTINGEAAPKSRKLFATILRDPAFKADWKNRAYKPLQRKQLAGNV